MASTLSFNVYSGGNPHFADQYNLGTLIASINVTNNTKLVDVANSIKDFVDTKTFKLIFRVYESTYRQQPHTILSILPIPPSIEVIVPNDLYIPEYQRFTIADVFNVDLSNKDKQYFMRTAGENRIIIVPFNEGLAKLL